MLYLVIITSLIVIDQWGKHLAEVYLKPIVSYPIIPGIFHLTYGRNTGAAFSILQGKQTLLIIFTTIILSMLIFYFIKNIKKGSPLLKLSLSFIIGGAVGNLIDRIRLSYVVDMFDFTLINYPVFNSADIFVVLGSIGITSVFLFTDTQKVG